MDRASTRHGRRLSRKTACDQALLFLRPPSSNPLNKLLAKEMQQDQRCACREETPPGEEDAPGSKALRPSSCSLRGQDECARGTVSCIRPFDNSTIRPLDHSTTRPFDHSTARPLDHSTARPSAHGDTARGTSSAVRYIGPSVLCSPDRLPLTCRAIHTMRQKAGAPKRHAWEPPSGMLGRGG